MFEMKRVKCWLYLTISAFVVGIIYLGYFCPTRICTFSETVVTPALTQTSTVMYLDALRLRTGPIHGASRGNASVNCNLSGHDNIGRFLRGKILHPNFTAEDLNSEYRFEMDDDRDVLVFLHMQKTGGTTFGRHLVKNIELKKPCVCYRGRKRCDCQNAHDHMWLFSRYSTGWRCGLHADWTELTSCVEDALNKMEDEIRPRRFLYITILREPFNRYVSEYKHVNRGATWMSVRLECNGRQASLEEVPFCFDGADWSGVTLDEFMSCPHNLANNRQTRMLANLSLSDCYGDSAMSRSERDCIMLNSAKENLRRMAFFGLTEYQLETQYLFEKTFGLQFNEDFFQYNHTHANEVVVSKAQKSRILQLNRLDMELYDYAKRLFFLRLETVRGDYALNQSTIGANAKRSASGHRGNEYEEGDENFADDDIHVNHRLVRISEHTKVHENKALRRHSHSTSQAVQS